MAVNGHELIMNIIFNDHSWEFMGIYVILEHE